MGTVNISENELKNIVEQQVRKALTESLNENKYIKKKPNGKWGIISAKTGKFWPADFDSEEDAEAGWGAYWANK